MPYLPSLPLGAAPNNRRDKMKTIWKFRITGDQTIEMPGGAKVLCVQEQKGDPYLWALVDSDTPTSKRAFSIFGTGHDVPSDPGSYIGTFQLNDGQFVFHVFEKEEGTR